VTLKNESEMLEKTNQACECCEGKVRSRQDWLNPSASHFLSDRALVP